MFEIILDVVLELKSPTLELILEFTSFALEFKSFALEIILELTLELFYLN